MKGEHSEIMISLTETMVAESRRAGAARHPPVEPEPAHSLPAAIPVLFYKGGS